MAFRLNAKLFSPTEALFDAARATSKGIEVKGTVEVEGVSCTTCRGQTFVCSIYYDRAVASVLLAIPSSSRGLELLCP
ncbi:hypothetical protein HZH68_010673 [Vespula germanica]|uniref:Uncharacterized protein n=1 Tax=Vespula germanica TaxID=30212 RepID=A0A834JVS3_VESGE|nr:hypothetical protein HZH68_010673 [Vespula germanica]